MKKRRTYNIRLIRSRRTYTIAELARLFGMHVRTVQSWHKQGLKPINPGEGHFLFMGKIVKDFLDTRQKARKMSLKEDEFYCPRCRTPRHSIPEKVNVIVTNKRIGRDDQHVHIKGKCKKCGCNMNRFTTRSRLKNSFWSQFISIGE